MPIAHVELLAAERRLHELPRSMERFRAYLQHITEGRDEAVVPPLSLMNPMGREHVMERLDEWIALGAEALAVAALREAEERLPLERHQLRHGLVVVDDVRGGWTNRYTSDAQLRFGEDDYARRHGWLATPLWASQTPSADMLRSAVLATCRRAVYRLEHGAPARLAEMLAQEGTVGVFAGSVPHLDEDDIAYTRAVVQPYLNSTNYPTCFVAMYGDGAARELGYPPLGLSERAGFAVAIADARQGSQEQ